MKSLGPEIVLLYVTASKTNPHFGCVSCVLGGIGQITAVLL